MACELREQTAKLLSWSEFLQLKQQHIQDGISNVEIYFWTDNQPYQTKPQEGTVLDPRNLEALARNLSINAGFAFSLPLTYAARASSTISLAFLASSIRARRVLRQSFLFSSRCSNLQKKKEVIFAIPKRDVRKVHRNTFFTFLHHNFITTLLSSILYD